MAIRFEDFSGRSILDLSAFQSSKCDGTHTLLMHRWWFLVALSLTARNRLPELLLHGHSRDGVTLHNHFLKTAAANRWQTLSPHWAVAPSLASLLIQWRSKNCQDTRLKHKMWDEPLTVFSPTNPRICFSADELLDSRQHLLLVDYLGERGCCRSKPHQTSPRILSRTESRWGREAAAARNKMDVILSFVFQSVCACLQHWRIRWGKIKSWNWGSGRVWENKRQPPLSPPRNHHWTL